MQPRTPQILRELHISVRIWVTGNEESKERTAPCPIDSRSEKHRVQNKRWLLWRCCRDWLDTLHWASLCGFGVSGIMRHHVPSLQLFAEKFLDPRAVAPRVLPAATITTSPRNHAPIIIYIIIIMSASHHGAIPFRPGVCCCPRIVERRVAPSTTPDRVVDSLFCAAMAVPGGARASGRPSIRTGRGVAASVWLSRGSDAAHRRHPHGGVARAMPLAPNRRRTGPPGHRGTKISTH